ncbi:MAG: restriction endonuclease subunit S [Candidatus Omnitrophica bacterium]|nr:restriction endonuclease subunit S [Candidatus Omnitrophota bacterium]
MIKINKSQWKTYKFGDITSNISERAEPKETKLDIYVGLEHLDPDCIHIKRRGHPSDVKGTKLRVYPGDIIFGKRRAYQRKAAIVDFDGICSAHAMVVRSNPKVIIPELLPFFMHSDVFMHRAVDVSEGSLSPTIKWKILAEQEFIIPQLGDQKRIADLLWSIDDIGESYINLFKKLTISKHSYFDVMYEDKKSNSLGISEIAEINPRLKQKDIPSNTLISFIAMADVSEEGCILQMVDKAYGDVKNGLTPFEEGDILFAKITPCMENGKGAIASGLKNRIGFGSTEFHILRPKIDTDRDYLFYLTKMCGLRKKAEQLMTGSAGQKRVPSDFFDFYKVRFPDASKRKLIGQQMKSFDEKIADLKGNIAGAKTIQKQIINQIFG